MLSRGNDPSSFQLENKDRRIHIRASQVLPVRKQKKSWDKEEEPKGLARSVECVEVL